MASEYLKTIRFKAIDKDLLLDHCIEATTLCGFKNIVINKGGYELKASAPLSWYSWGEIISIELSKIDSLVEIEIRSRCKLITQIIDWGKNRRNVKRLISVFENQGLLRA